MYVNSTYKYLHDFRRPVKNATSKSKSEWELIGVFKLRQTQQSLRVVFNSSTTTREAHQAAPGLSMGPWKEHRS